jgi:tetratricopeptide (TPR) repeat protein
MRITPVLLRLIGSSIPGCPSEADLLAYSENRLSRVSRSQYEQHFAECGDCLELLAYLGREPLEVGQRLPDKAAAEQTGRVLSLIQADERKRFTTTPQKRAAAGFYVSYFKLATVGLAISAIAVAGVLLLTRGQAPAAAAMDAVRLAVKDARYTQARVTGLEYSRYGATRGNDSSDDDLQFSRALGKLKSAEQEGAPVNDRLVLARVYLARGTPEDATRALTILTQLAAYGVETPESLNDTGVAQLELQKYNDAIPYFSKALANTPTYYEALFNRALAEENAHRDTDARADWERFIDQAPEDDWKNEARMHLDSLRNLR